MKRKLLLPILSVCMVVALVSVGFAAWLITGADTSDDAQGQFITYGVSNEYFTVKIDPTNVNDTKIIFGKQKDSQDKGNWFQWGDDVKKEQLSKEFTVTVTFDDFSDKTDEDIKAVLNKWDITLNMITADATSDDKKDAYKNATTKKYIAEPKFYVNGSTSAATVEGTTILGTLETNSAEATGGIKLKVSDWKGTGNDAGNGTIETDTNGKKFVQAKVKVTFAWGDYFKVSDQNVNPEVYFMGSNFANGSSNTFAKGSKAYADLDNDSKAALRTEAQVVMKAINMLSAQKFTIKLGAVVKANNNA